MNSMRFHHPALIIALSFICSPAFTQTFKFKTFDKEQGICNPFVYTMNQDKNGYLWLGTGEGLCRFDGFNFHGDQLADSLIQGFVTCSYKDQYGRLWFGYNDGNVVCYDGIRHRILNTRSFTTGNINKILSDEEGNILIATQSNGLIKEMASGSDSLLHIAMSHLIYSMEINGWDLLIGTGNGLYIYRQVGHTGPVELISEVRELAGQKIQCITGSGENNAYWVCTSDHIYSMDLEPNSTGTPVVKNMTSTLGLGRLNIQSVTEDDEHQLWVSTYGNGIFRLQISPGNSSLENPFQYNQQNGLMARNIKQVFQDMEGNIWIATFGNGIAMLTSEAFVVFPLAGDVTGNNVLSLHADGESLWIGGENGLVFYRSVATGESVSYSTRQGLPPGRITAVYKDTAGNVWAGTEMYGMYMMPHGSSRFRNIHASENNLENNIRSVTGFTDKVWFATRNGVFSMNIYTGEKKQFTTSSVALPHNDINHLFIDRDGNVWLSTTSSALYRIDPSGNAQAGITFQTNVHGIMFNSMAADQDGDFWAITNSTGVFCFADDTVINLTRKEGLLSNYCYSLLVDTRGDIWVGHRSGFSRIRKKDMLIHSYGTDYGINGDCNGNAMVQDAAGRVYIGTTDGLVRYDPELERENTTAPFANIVSLLVSDKEVDFTREVVLPYDIYKLRIDFLGLNYRDPAKVTYQYMLENYDITWSEPGTATYALYNRVADGNYRFLLKTFNSDGVVNEAPLALSIRVKKPFWKQLWFIISSIVFVISVFVVIVKIRERNQKKLQEYLETELAARTREVIEQKEELEVKNREITDSINYAQRIQTSILPPVRKIQELFPGSFIFYQPRDIVSGDFFWFDRMGKDKFMIVCADSTGHGVPGAFMSMIGATLIKDLTARSREITPAQLLETLDNEITGTLNQNIDAERSHDGMDITVCEIHLPTLHLRFASAMRPLIISHKNELMYIRGNRSSIGGEFFDSKLFIDQEYQLLKGDRIYMFSDGYPDQFGGPLGKKFKMVRLKELLDNIQDKPMEEQYLIIRDTFNEWKGDHPQIDDVLFMAIQV